MCSFDEPKVINLSVAPDPVSTSFYLLFVPTLTTPHSTTHYSANMSNLLSKQAIKGNHCQGRLYNDFQLQDTFGTFDIFGCFWSLGYLMLILHWHGCNVQDKRCSIILDQSGSASPQNSSIPIYSALSNFCHFPSCCTSI